MAMMTPSAILELIETNQEHNRLLDSLSLRIWHFLRANNNKECTLDEILRGVTHKRQSISKSEIVKRVRYMTFLGIIKEIERFTRTKSGNKTKIRAYVAVPLHVLEKRVVDQLQSLDLRGLTSYII